MFLTSKTSERQKTLHRASIYLHIKPTPWDIVVSFNISLKEENYF